MFQFETTDHKFYSLPEEYVRNYGGYFGLVEEGDMQLHSHQVNFIFYALDHFKKDEFVKSIPLFFQFSIPYLDDQVLDKIQFMMEEDGQKIDLNHPEDRDYFLNLITEYTTEDTTWKDLKKMILDQVQTMWTIGNPMIVQHLQSLETPSKIKKYVMKLSEIDDTVISHLKKPLSYYFGKDDFDDYLIGHLHTIRTNAPYRGLLHKIFNYANFNFIRYLFEDETPLDNYIEKEDLLNNPIEKDGTYPIHYACKRNMEEMIYYLIDKGVDFNMVDGETSALPINYICLYGSPELLQYILQRVDIDIDYDEGNSDPVYDLRRNPKMNVFLQNIGLKIYDNIENVRRRAGW